VLILEMKTEKKKSFLYTHTHTHTQEDKEEWINKIFAKLRDHDYTKFRKHCIKRRNKAHIHTKEKVKLQFFILAILYKKEGKIKHSE
jgi:hypothetical protein